jgi:hypothetical protein
MDWGFCVFANDMEEAAAVFDSKICPNLLGLASSLSTASSGGGGGGPGGGAPGATAGRGGLAGALGRLGSLLSRSHSEPPEAVVTPAASAHVLQSSGGGGGGGAPGGAPGGPPGVLSEPSSPMVGALLAAHCTFFQAGPGGSGAGALGSGNGGGGGGGADALPDSIRAAPGVHKAHESDHFRVPSFQMGLKPW